MNERIIFHSDLNNFYTSVKCPYHLEYRGKPFAVLGDPEACHGIVLASPRFEIYMKHFKLVREIYFEYTD
ncbi:hypothetical protein [Ruminococcus sp. Marseille-P6503]|uniref:hypothetical protein n=1 Tax=Ruminococcus sp. Marseille-P6503 TaxID=2364796 RepID=UPI000F51E5B1|nr:hypothetical protein [Ruminococcus sp. Marseille-P6503]